MEAKKHFWVDYLACLIFGAVIVPLWYGCNTFNCRQVTARGFFVAIAIFTGVHVVCFWGLGLFLKGKERRFFFLYCTWCFFWFAIPIGRRFVFLCGTYYAGYRWLFVAFLAMICFCAVFFFSIRIKSDTLLEIEGFIRLFVYLLFVVLLFYSCRNFLIYSRRFPDTEKIEGNYRNIYYILLDAHPSGKAFLEQLGGDLKPFYRELEKLGFVTYPTSESGYPCTRESVSSTWHMDAEVHDSIIGSAALKNLVKTHAVRFYLGIGYLRCIYDYGAADNIKLVHSRDLSAFLDFLLSGSVLCRLYDKLNVGGAQSKRKDVRLILDYLENGKRRHGSFGNFFCAHILVPHFPLVYSEGVNRPVEPNLNAVCHDDFRGVRYGELLCSLLRQEVCAIDRLVLKTIKAILKEYESEIQKPIIVLCSDHGSLNHVDKDGLVARPPYVTKETVYGNLFAIYMPEEWKKDAKGLKFINLYRFIFNHLFGTNYEYLPDVRKNLDGSVFKQKTLPSSG